MPNLLQYPIVMFRILRPVRPDGRQYQSAVYGPGTRSATARFRRFVERYFGVPAERDTPVKRLADGVDYQELKPWRMYVIQFLNIAGLGFSTKRDYLKNISYMFKKISKKIFKNLYKYKNYFLKNSK